MTDRQLGGCKFESCRQRALIISEFCWKHLADKPSYKQNLALYVKNGGSLKNANLSHADLKDFDLMRADISGANLSRSDLTSLNLFDANAENAEFLGANLTGADLTSANLSGSDLTRCSLNSARLWHANLENTNLIEADLNRCDMWSVRLYNTRLWRTEFSGAISLSKKSFARRINKYDTVYRINESGIHSAEDAYRCLKKYFMANGRYDDASWASFKEKTMEKCLLKKSGNIAYIPHLIMGGLSGYGERPHRIILSSFFVITIFAVLFAALNAVTCSASPSYNMSIADYFYYSVVTFTTVGYGDFIPKAAPFFRGLAATEAFIGAFLIGLFIFTLARKYSAR